MDDNTASLVEPKSILSSSHGMDNFSMKDNDWWFSQWRHQIAKSKKQGFTNSDSH